MGKCKRYIKYRAIGSVKALKIEFLILLSKLYLIFSTSSGNERNQVMFVNLHKFVFDLF